MKIILHTPLTIDAIRTKLSVIADEEGPLDWLSNSGYSSQFLFKLNKNRLSLHRWHRQYRNSFAPFFYGYMSPQTNGTRIAGYFAMHLVAKGFMIVWLVGIALLGGIVSTSVFIRSSIGEGTIPTNPLSALVSFIPPLLMILGGISIVWIGKLIGKWDEKSILQFIQENFDAVIVKE